MNTRSTSVLAVVSLIAGLLGWTVMPVIGSIAAIITGHMARREIRDNPDIDGGGMALGGLLLGYAMVVVLAVMLLAGIGMLLLFGRAALMGILGQ